MYVVEREREKSGDPSTAHNHAVLLLSICFLNRNPNPTPLPKIGETNSQTAILFSFNSLCLAVISPHTVP